MGEESRVSLRNYYREHIRALIKKDAEAAVDLFVDQHTALDALTKAVEKQREIIDELELKIKELEKRLDEDSHNSHKPPSSDNPYTKPEKKTKSRRKRIDKKPGA